MAGWKQKLEPFRGAKIVQYHPDFVYLFTRFGLVKAGAVEEQARHSADARSPRPSHRNHEAGSG